MFMRSFDLRICILIKYPFVRSDGLNVVTMGFVDAFVHVLCVSAWCSRHQAQRYLWCVSSHCMCPLGDGWRVVLVEFGASSPGPMRTCFRSCSAPLVWVFSL